jgi:hypothetical protein
LQQPWCGRPIVRPNEPSLAQRFIAAISLRARRLHSAPSVVPQSSLMRLYPDMFQLLRGKSCKLQAEKGNHVINKVPFGLEASRLEFRSQSWQCNACLPRRSGSRDRVSAVRICRILSHLDVPGWRGCSAAPCRVLQIRKLTAEGLVAWLTRASADAANNAGHVSCVTPGGHR